MTCIFYMTCTGAGLAFSQYSRFEKRLHFLYDVHRRGLAFSQYSRFDKRLHFYMTCTGADWLSANIPAFTNAYTTLINKQSALAKPIAPLPKL